MKKPLVSILMPAYNAEKFIAEAIESIRNQDHENWELLVLDDASSDSTLQIIKSFSNDRIKLFCNEKNEGYLKSCNRLFSLTSGEFITFLDADDTCPANRISTCLAAFKADSELGFLTTGFARTDARGLEKSVHTYSIDYAQYANNHNYLPTICGASLMFRASCLEHTSGYREVFSKIGGEDYFFIWELSVRTKGEHLTEVVYNYRTHESQLTKSNAEPLQLFMLEILSRLREMFLRNAFDAEIANKILEGLEREIEDEPVLVQFKLIEKSINANQFKAATDLWFATLANPWSMYIEKKVILAYTIARRWFITSSRRGAAI